MRDSLRGMPHGALGKEGMTRRQGETNGTAEPTSQRVHPTSQAFFQRMEQKTGEGRRRLGWLRVRCTNPSHSSRGSLQLVERLWSSRHPGNVVATCASLAPIPSLPVFYKLRWNIMPLNED
uniref:Uncharacterized protein n=1 Tax=Sphaerodactylus townsendi TaxID=933632 RepID=A0ACB8ETC6_9SAUR